VARIKAVLRRSEAGKRPPKVIEVGDLRIREQVGPHAGLLGTLAGVDKRDFRAYAVLMTSRPL